MLPIAPLMIEHRLMDRILGLIRKEFRVMQAENRCNIDFINGAVEFLKTYVGLCHHGKEDEVLFKTLEAKDISPELKGIMERLIKEHALSHRIVQRLEDAKFRYIQKEWEAMAEMKNCLSEILELAPSHIETEDKHFFLPSMKYLDEKEKAVMLAEMEEFDRRLFHKIYKDMVERFEQKA